MGYSPLLNSLNSTSSVLNFSMNIFLRINSSSKILMVNSERSSQKYISDYEKVGQNNQKIKYKQRPLREIEEE